MMPFMQTDIVYAADGFDHGIFDGSSCAFGVFDGIHRGHRFLFDEAMKGAVRNGGRSIIMTFDVDPDELFRSESLHKLLTNQERIQGLARLGFDAVVVFRFDRAFANQSPEDFLKSTFGSSAPKEIHVGRDFRFGSYGSGTVETMEKFMEEDCDVVPHDLLTIGDAPVTATRIRGLLREHNIDKANELLGRPYSFGGTVEAGRGEGREFGFRTANITVPPMLRVLEEGVYGGYAEVGGECFKCALSFGPAPTFANAVSTVEAHLLDFSGDIYGQDIRIEPREYLRPLIKFDSIDALIATVTENIQWVRENL